MLSRPGVWSVGTRGAGAAFGFLSVFIVSQQLSAAEQGVYYAYGSLLALLVVAEFGLSYAVMQAASHASVQWTDGGRAIGSADALGYLATLTRRATRWLAAETALLALLLLLAAGAYVAHASDASDVGSGGVLLAATLSAGICWQLVNPVVAVLEGAGRVVNVWRLRFLQECAGGVVLCVGLALGAGVGSLALSYAARALVGAVVARRLYARSGLGAAASGTTLGWLTTIWPFQWRIGASTLSGYLLFQSFAPLMLVLAGPVAAGQFGMTLAITNALLAASTAWPVSQAPIYGALIARGDHQRLDAMFARTAVRSTGLALLGVAGVLAGAWALEASSSPIRGRLLPGASFAWIVATAVLNHVGLTLATYLRAFRREPLLLPSVIGAFVMFGAMAACARWSTVARTATAYWFLTLLGLCVTTAIFVHSRRRWHRDATGSAPLADRPGLNAGRDVSGVGA